MQAKIYLALCVIVSLFIGAQCGLTEEQLQHYRQQWPNYFVCNPVSNQVNEITSYHETCYTCCDKHNRNVVVDGTPCLCAKWPRSNSNNRNDGSRIVVRLN